MEELTATPPSEEEEQEVQQRGEMAEQLGGGALPPQEPHPPEEKEDQERSPEARTEEQKEAVATGEGGVETRTPPSGGPQGGVLGGPQGGVLRGPDLLGYVGIEAVLDQMRRKTMKAGFEFNIMVVGESLTLPLTLTNPN